MTFENIIYDKIILSLVLISIPLIASTNIDCGGNSFHCLNSTHFIICVDFGKGVSKTVDDFVIPCPPPTICDRTNRYECEFPDINTPALTVQPIETTNDIESTSLPWEKFAVTVTLPNTALEQHLELSTDGVALAAVSSSRQPVAADNIFDPVNGNEAGNIQITTETAIIKVTVNKTEASEAFVTENKIVTVTQKNMTGDSSMTKVMAPVFSQVTTSNIGNVPESINEIVIGPISGNQTDGVIVDMPQAAILSVTEPTNASVAEPSSIYATEHVTSILYKEVIASENIAVILNDTVPNITVKQETEETLSEKHLLNKTVPFIIDIKLTITNKSEKAVGNIIEPTALNVTKTVIVNVTDQAFKTLFDRSAFTETMITTGNKTELIIANQIEPADIIVTEVNTTYATELPFANVSEIVTSILTESTNKTMVEPALPNKIEPTTWTVTESTTRNTSEPVIIIMTEPSFTNETLPVTSTITESTAIILEPSSTSVTESAIMIATNSILLSETEVDVANMTESVTLISRESARKTMSEPAITNKTESSTSSITESTSKNINEPAIANVTELSITNKTLPTFWTITEITAGVITEPYVVNVTEAAILITTDATISHGTEIDIANVTESSAFISTESTGKYMAEPGIINETEPSSWTATESSGRNMSEPAVENVLELSTTNETILATWILTKSTDLVALNKTESTAGMITELAIPINVTKPAIVIDMAPIILNATELPTATVNESDTWISIESTNKSITTLPLTIEIEPGTGDITGSSTRKMTEPTISNVTESAIMIITEPMVRPYATKIVISNVSESAIINRTISSIWNLTKSGGEKITEPGIVNVTVPATAYLIERDTNVATSATPVSTDSINENMTEPALPNESESANWIATKSPTGIVTESDVANVTEPTVTWIITEPTTRIKTELPITNKREAVIIIATHPNLTYASEPDIANVTESYTWIKAKSTNIVMEHEQTKTNETEPTSSTVTESITKIINEPVFANVTELPKTNASIVAQSPELSDLTETELTTGIMTKLVNTTNSNESAIETAIVTDLIMADATDLPVSNLNESVSWISTEWIKGIIKEPAITTNKNELESGKITKSTSLNMKEPTITNVTEPIITYAIEKVSNVTEPGAAYLTEIDFTNMTESLTYSTKGNMTEQPLTKESESADWVAMESFSKFVTEPDVAKVTEPTIIIEKDPIITYATEQVIAKVTEPSITNGYSPATRAVTESITGIIKKSVIETAIEPVIINGTVPDSWKVTKSDSQIIKEPVIAYVTEIYISNNISESDAWISTELTNVPMAEPTLKNVKEPFDGIVIKSTARNITEPIMENVTEAATMIATDVIMTHVTELANGNIVQPVITNATEPNNWIIPESSTGNVTGSIFAHLSESTTWTVAESMDGNMEQVISNITEPSIGNTTNSVTLILTELINGNKTKQIDSIVLKSVLGSPTELTTDNKSKSVNKLATEAIIATEMAPALTKSNPTKHSITAGNMTIPGIVIGAGSKNATKEMTSSNIKIIPVNLSINTPEVVANKSVVTVTETIQTANVQNVEHASSTALVATTVKNTMSNSKYFTAGIDTIANTTSDINSTSTDNNSYVTINADSGLSLSTKISTIAEKTSVNQKQIEPKVITWTITDSYATLENKSFNQYEQRLPTTQMNSGNNFLTNGQAEPVKSHNSYLEAQITEAKLNTFDGKSTNNSNVFKQGKINNKTNHLNSEVKSRSSRTESLLSSGFNRSESSPSTLNPATRVGVKFEIYPEGGGNTTHGYLQNNVLHYLKNSSLHEIPSALHTATSTSKGKHSPTTLATIVKNVEKIADNNREVKTTTNKSIKSVISNHSQTITDNVKNQDMHVNKNSINRLIQNFKESQFLTSSPSEFTINDYFQSNLSPQSLSNVQDSKMVNREPQILINNNYEQTNPLQTVVLNSTGKISNKIPTIAGSTIPKNAGSIFFIVPQNSNSTNETQLKKIPLLLGNFKTTKLTGKDILTSEAPSNMLSFSNKTERDLISSTVATNPENLDFLTKIPPPLGIDRVELAVNINQEKVNYFKLDNQSSLPVDINQEYNVHNLKNAKSLQENYNITEPVISTSSFFSTDTITKPSKIASSTTPKTFLQRTKDDIFFTVESSSYIPELLKSTIKMPQIKTNITENVRSIKSNVLAVKTEIDTEPKTGSLSVLTPTNKLIKNYQETNTGVNYASLHKEENSTKKYIITPVALSTLIPKQSSSVNTRVVKTDDLHPSIWLTGYYKKKETGDSLTKDKVFTKENSTYDNINTTETTPFSSASKLSNSQPVAQIDTSRVNTKNITVMNPNLNSESSRPDNSQMASSTEVYTDPATLVSSPVNKLTSKDSITKINTKKDLGRSTVVTPLTPEQTSTVSVSGTSQFKLTFDCQVHPRGRYADDHDCRKFYICNGTPYSIVGLCPSNTVFSEIRKLCTKNLSHCIRNNEFHCTSTGRFSDFWKTNIYYICVRKANTFLRFKLQCQSGYILNKTTVRCYENAEPSSLAVSNSNDDSQIKTEKKVEKEKKARKSKKKNKNKGFECEKEGKFPDSDDCRKYYICSQSDKSEEFYLKVKKCDTDETYDKKKKKCVDSSSYECS